MRSVELNSQEVLLAHQLAVARNNSCRTNGISDKQMGKQDPIQIDWDGALAELACGKVLNCYPDLSISPRKGGVDLISKGKRIDVKATRYKDGNLAIHIDKSPEDVDIYILAVVEGNIVHIKGYIKSIDAIKTENISDLGHGKSYVIPQSRLLAL